MAVVTGASRGWAGIARGLGEAGATVYVTGRTAAAGTDAVPLPGTIPQTAAEVDGLGGVGIPVVCDHRDDEQVRALFQRVEAEQGRLDVLVNNVWGGYERFNDGSEFNPGPFWEQPLSLWDAMHVAGVRAHCVASVLAAPLLLAMLERIERDRDVDVVVVHKVDRLARNIEDHVAIRAALRRAGCQLVSITENLEESASGKLVEGIHALMAEFYSSNLSSEIRKGLTQKAKMGGYPHRAPLGYLNVRETIGGRQVASITVDPDRAPLVTAAFDLYATGDWTLERLHDELHRRGLRNRGTRKRPPGTVSLNGLSVILGNRTYIGEVQWGGVRYPGQHDPLTSPATFDTVQQLLTTRAARGTRERKHPHYLKGLLHCAVCGRRLSIQVSKKRQYTYFFCLGQKSGGPCVCREPYTPADTLEQQLADLYRRVQLPALLITQLTADLDTEIAARSERDTAERHHQHPPDRRHL